MEYNSLKKGFTLVAFTFLCLSHGYAQNWNEIFRQKRTQQKYLLQQIAALEVFTNYLRKGYEIASSGLQTIHDLSNGEFNLHNSFLSTLKKVNPAIKQNRKVAEIIEMQILIGKAFNTINEEEKLTFSNQQYIKNVRDNLWQACLKDIEELLLVITSGQIEMSDDQRLERLDRIYLSMGEKSAFTQKFMSEINLLLQQKVFEQKLINEIKNSYGIQ